MTGRMVTCQEEVYELPALTSWKLIRTGGVPCDSFTVTFLYSPGMAEPLHLAAGFQAFDGERLLLRGFVDEYTISVGVGGRTVSLSGRGYAGRLLDNESRPLTYESATLEEIIRGHVTPCGITCSEIADLRADSVYKVAAGTSQWKALDGFCRVYGGFSPAFLPDGRLLAAPVRNPDTVVLDSDRRMLSLTLRENHYGVLSEALVIDKTRNAAWTVKNQDWLDRGGQCRRVLYTPGQSTWAAMRYTGEYQIAESRKDETVLQTRLSGTVAADPGSRVTLSRPDWGFSGTYALAQVEHDGSPDGETTLLTLKAENSGTASA